MYGLYLPELLSQFGVSRQTALTLLTVENGLAIAMSLLTLASGLIGTAKGLVTETTLRFRPAITFAVGSLLKLGNSEVESVSPSS